MDAGDRRANSLELFVGAGGFALNAGAKIALICKKLRMFRHQRIHRLLPHMAERT